MNNSFQELKDFLLSLWILIWKVFFQYLLFYGTLSCNKSNTFTY
jgi:hypothetical protein